MNQLRDLLNRLFYLTGSYNTCNGWGFGGGTGNYWEGDDPQGHRIVVKIGTAYYRHLRSTSFITVSCDGRRHYDEVQSDENARAVIAILERNFNAPQGTL